MSIQTAEEDLYVGKWIIWTSIILVTLVGQTIHSTINWGSQEFNWSKGINTTEIKINFTISFFKIRKDPENIEKSSGGAMNKLENMYKYASRYIVRLAILNRNIVKLIKSPVTPKTSLLSKQHNYRWNFRFYGFQFIAWVFFSLFQSL